MKLSTTLSTFFVNPKNDPQVVLADSIRLCARMGFEVLDFPFCSGVCREFLSEGGDWKTPVTEAKKLAESLGCKFRYAHVPFGYPAPEDEQGWKDFDYRVRRALEACAELGVEWTAIHPYDMAIPQYDAEAAHERSMKHLTPYAHLAQELGVGIAVENMVDRVLVPYRRYCSTAENLKAVIDDLRREVGSDRYVGACLDTGHANACGLNHYAAVKVLGSRLKMLHVNDNNGLADDHVPICAGTVIWENLMKGLREVEFAGDFNYEISFRHLPENAGMAREALMHYLVEIGRYYINLK